MGGKDETRGRSGALCIRSGPDSGLIVALGDHPAVVGRETGCEVRLTDPAVSRRHFQIIPRPDGRWTIEDLESSNGTFVGGKRVTRTEIGPGDEISLGETRLQVLSEEESGGSLRRRVASATERDPVAQVCSRKLFDLRLRTEVALANRTGAILSLALIEIDRARALESWEPGLTRLLPAVALKLSGLLGGNDVLARFGEASFAALILGTDPTLAYVTAERLCTATQFVSAEIAGRRVAVTSSVGLATDKGRRDLTADELVARARGQVTLAREAGGNCVSRWVHVSARIRIPALSSDLLPTELEQARKTKVLRTVSLPSGMPTIPPPAPGRTPPDDEDPS